jgi:hypothetical protein
MYVAFIAITLSNDNKTGVEIGKFVRLEAG